MSFTADMAKFCRTTAPDHLARVVRIATVEIGSRAVDRSPVGDASYWSRPAPPGYAGGRFRANWMHGHGAPPAGTLDAIDPSGSATVQRITGDVLASPAFGVAYIVNNLPYAQRIEDGWSWNQAPNGILSLLELEFPSIVKRAEASA